MEVLINKIIMGRNFNHQEEELNMYNKIINLKIYQLWD